MGVGLLTMLQLGEAVEKELASAYEILEQDAKGLEDPLYTALFRQYKEESMGRKRFLEQVEAEYQKKRKENAEKKAAAAREEGAR